MEASIIFGFVLFLTVHLHGGWAGRPFNSHQSPKETIKNYEVFTPVINYGDRQVSSLNFSIVTKTYNFTIRLTMNKQLLSPGFTSKYFDFQGNDVVIKGHRNCFYHGEVEGYPSWTATISTCSGIRGSFGDMATKTSLFHVEPFGVNKNKTLDQLHVIFMETEYQNRTRTCGTSTSHGHIVRPEKIGRELHHLTERFERQATGQSGSNLIVELVIINDFTQYQKYGSDLQTTVNRAIEITNGVDSLFKTFGIRIVLVGIITWTSRNLISVVSDSSTTLSNLQVYSPSLTIQRDVTMLLTGTRLDSNVVGLAYVSGMCNPYSVGLVEDFGSLPAVSSTAAHEMGHLFSMVHDTASCTCAQSTGCIMAAVQGSDVPNQWSSCSVGSINLALSTSNLGSCLTNLPQTIIGTPKCGNGIREGNETCDCGSPQECTDPCCNSSTCQLAAGAQCTGGVCCNNCRFVAYGTQCRASIGECDVAEMCTGCSSQCPADQYVQDGTSCGSGSGYCYRGACPARDSQCKALYGPLGGDGVTTCYTNYNTRGDLHGNCGPTGSSTYTACSASNVLCGSVQCTNAGNQFPTVSIIGSIQLGTHGTCKSFLVTPSDGSITNIWLVQNGTKCGIDQICLSSQCLPLSSLATPACPVGSNGLVCSGNGVCTNGGNCSCKVGFVGSACGNIYTSSVCAAPVTTPTSSSVRATPTSSPVTTPTSALVRATPTSAPVTTPTSALVRAASTSAPVTTPTSSSVKTTPTSAPLATPTSTPVRTIPISAPVTTPTSSPFKTTPTSVPVTTPTSSPVKTTPTSAPLATPVRATPTSAPVITPTSAPVKTTPTSTPVTTTTSAPVRAIPTSSPVRVTPTSAPVTTPTSAPVTTPTSAAVIRAASTPASSNVVTSSKLASSSASVASTPIVRQTYSTSIPAPIATSTRQTSAVTTSSKVVSFLPPNLVPTPSTPASVKTSNTGVRSSSTKLLTTVLQG